MYGKSIKIHHCLIPLSWLYGIGTEIRNKLFDWGILPAEEFDIPVISVGNLAVGGTGKISGIVIGVFLLQIIFVGLNFLSVDQNLLYVIKGMIILVACAIDMRKYLVKR